MHGWGFLSPQFPCENTALNDTQANNVSDADRLVNVARHYQ
jgi:hypothetical protein